MYICLKGTQFLKINEGNSLSEWQGCTIGRKSRATFGIPAKRLNITIYPSLYYKWFSKL